MLFRSGADAVLVILSCTDDALALDLTQAALDLDMDALIEIGRASCRERV